MASQQPYYNASTTRPVVVQGVAVNNGGSSNPAARIYDHKNVNHGVGAMETDVAPHLSPLNVGDNDGEEGGEWTKGEVQPRRCNDLAFAVLFYAHLGVMAWVAAAFAPRMYGEVAESVANGGGRRDLAESGDYSVGDYDVDDVKDYVCAFVSWAAQSGSSAISSVLSYASSYSSDGSNDGSNDSDRRLEEDGGDGGEDGGEGNYGTNDVGDMMFLLAISAPIALVVSTLALGVMIRHAQLLIKFALLFNIASTALFAVGALFLSPFAALCGFGLLALTVYYAYVVWGRIPFAACNLETATTAVRANLGLAFYAYSSLLVMVAWSAWWAVSFVSAAYVAGGCDGQGNCQNDVSGLLIFALLLSYYWTFQVIKNVVHVTVAGAVGTWWFAPEEGSSCCSNGVRDSFLRAVTTSFGSICLGSLLVAIIEASKTMVRHLRESEDGGGILLCLAECLLSCLQDIMEFFNTWAYVFVGLYGYTFVEAGINVINLFKTRGWTTIITDSLAQSVLGMLSAAVGLITGLVALGIAQVRGMVFGDELGASAAAFFIGFVVGTVLTSTLMTLVSSAVNTVVVCYAEAPREFEENHPKLSADMRAAWRQAWPGEFSY